MFVAVVKVHGYVNLCQAFSPVFYYLYCLFHWLLKLTKIPKFAKPKTGSFDQTRVNSTVKRHKFTI